jgi:uncharacterized membrane protein YeaQ/YmgE (transglycosylase-associated protein family)
MVQLLAWLVAGGIIGLLASLVIKTDGLQDLLLNLGGGITGAALGGWLVSPVVGAGTIDQDAFSVAAVGVAAASAIVMLVILDLFRPGSLR